MFGYNLVNQLQSGGAFMMTVAFCTIEQLVLCTCVLVHEFGHGNMSRYLGGEISQILLWPFGGICFSSRGPESDPEKILRNELLIVGAGPTTHFPHTLIWIALLSIVWNA